MKKTILILAGILILFVLVGSVVLHLTGGGGGGGLSEQVLWRATFAGGTVDTLKAIDLTGDGEDEVLIQTPAEIAILAADGTELYRQNAPLAKSTMGDFDGDGTDEFALAEPNESGLRVTALEADGGILWQINVPQTGLPARGTSLDLNGDGQREAIFGTENGVLVALDGASGALLWRYDFPAAGGEDSLVRGSDDVRWQGSNWLAVANYGGHVALLDGEGQPAWEFDFPQQLRRLRTFDVDGDGTSEILIGGIDGLIWLVSAAGGQALWQATAGSRVDEARFLELDGDPTSSEIVIGGKNGGVLAFLANGDELWKRSVTGKVQELITLDLDADGQNELLVAADQLNVLAGATGATVGRLPLAASAIDVGDFGKSGGFLTNDGSDLVAVEVESRTTPLWRSPIVIGLILAVIIAGVAVVISRSSLGSDEQQVLVIQDQSMEALLAKKQMLREELVLIDRMQQNDQLTSEAYLIRSKSILERLSAVEENILKLEPNYKPEVMHCPSCAAPLETGLDRCAYCGHVLL